MNIRINDLDRRVKQKLVSIFNKSGSKELIMHTIIKSGSLFIYFRVTKDRKTIFESNNLTISMHEFNSI